jgi:L-lactate utilization protein LutB
LKEYTKERYQKPEIKEKHSAKMKQYYKGKKQITAEYEAQIQELKAQIEPKRPSLIEKIKALLKIR